RRGSSRSSSFRLRSALHHGGPYSPAHHITVLVTSDVFKLNHTLPWTGPGQPLTDAYCFRVQGVSVEHRGREGDLSESEVGDDGAQGQLGNRQPDHGGQRPHRVDQALAVKTLLARRPVGIQM